MRRFRADRKGGGPLSGTLYVSSLITPPHVLKTFRRNALTIADSLRSPIDPQRGHVITTQDSGSLRSIPGASVDYIFTDPPFGYNFDYSELNFFWEGLLKVVTNQKNEAIVSTSQGKGLDEYREPIYGEGINPPGFLTQKPAVVRDLTLSKESRKQCQRMLGEHRVDVRLLPD
jgi:hypothetical protein